MQTNFVIFVSFLINIDMKNIMTDPDNQLGYLLMQVSFLKQRIVNAALKELDITYIQFVILAGTYELGGENGVVTQQDIADKRRLDKAMVSNVVKALIGKGLMNRYMHPVDGRAYALSLTSEGEKMAVEGKKIALKVDQTFFAGIDQEALFNTLSFLIENGELS